MRALAQLRILPYGEGFASLYSHCSHADQNSGFIVQGGCVSPKITYLVLNLVLGRVIHRLMSICDGSLSRCYVIECV